MCAWLSKGVCNTRSCCDSSKNGRYVKKHIVSLLAWLKQVKESNKYLLFGCVTKRLALNYKLILSIPSDILGGLRYVQQQAVDEVINMPNDFITQLVNDANGRTDHIGSINCHQMGSFVSEVVKSWVIWSSSSITHLPFKAESMIDSFIECRFDIRVTTIPMYLHTVSTELCISLAAIVFRWRELLSHIASCHVILYLVFYARFTGAGSYKNRPLVLHKNGIEMLTRLLTT